MWLVAMTVVVEVVVDGIWGAQGEGKEIERKADARGINRGRRNYCDGNDARRDSL